MDTDLVRLAQELHRMGGGNVMVSNMKSSDLTLLVGVPDELAQRYVDRLHVPHEAACRGGNDIGAARSDKRHETPTEAALMLFGLKPEELVNDLRLLGVSLEVMDGDLYLDGVVVMIVLVNGRCQLPALLDIKRQADDGVVYPLFERQELVPDTQHSRLLVSV